MHHRNLGRTGLEVSPYRLGALMFATQMGNESQGSVRISHKALDVGINLSDTADVYADSEEVVATALKGRRDNVVLTTKFGLRIGAAPRERTSRAHRGAGS